MKQGFGMPVVPGVTMGKIFVYPRARSLSTQRAGTPQEEQQHFEQACKSAREQLGLLYHRVKEELGEQEASILEVQQLILDDMDFLSGVAGEIQLGHSAIDAVLHVGKTMARVFSSMDDDYMKERATDVLDVSVRIANIISGAEGIEFPSGEFIVVAEDLTPSQTVQLPKERVVGLLLQKGSTTGHTAILARTYNIPSIIQSDFSWEEIAKATMLAMDSEQGVWYADPTDDIMNEMRQKEEAYQKQVAFLEQYRGKPSRTKSGKEVLLCANIGSTEEAEVALNADAQGIGLMRSEFLYFGRNTLPSEEELFDAYAGIVGVMGEKPVIIRTLDIGADKQVEYLNFIPEDNPALGLRGIRFCLEQKEVLVTQLRAIYRASALGNVSVMFPMITSLWELKEAISAARQVYRGLQEEGIDCKNIPIGMMIETPSSAIMANTFAKEVDFFSVGTNDLTQYTLALDRQNPLLIRYYDSHHPAVLMLLRYIAQCAKDHGIWAGVCGELAGDETVTEQLIGMGYRELSMVPGKILSVRRQICESEV